MANNHFHPNMKYDDTLSYNDCLNKCVDDKDNSILNVIEKISYNNDKHSNNIINFFNVRNIILLEIITIIILFYIIYLLQ